MTKDKEKDVGKKFKEVKTWMLYRSCTYDSDWRNIPTVVHLNIKLKFQLRLILICKFLLDWRYSKKTVREKCALRSSNALKWDEEQEKAEWGQDLADQDRQHSKHDKPRASMYHWNMLCWWLSAWSLHKTYFPKDLKLRVSYLLNTRKAPYV